MISFINNVMIIIPIKHLGHFKNNYVSCSCNLALITEKMLRKLFHQSSLKAAIDSQRNSFI